MREKAKRAWFREGKNGIDLEYVKNEFYHILAHTLCDTRNVQI